MDRRQVLTLAIASPLLLTACAATGPRDTLVTVARRRGGLTRFLSALETAGLATMLQSDATFTLFAPSDQAIAAAGAPFRALLQPARKTELRALLGYHVVQGVLASSFLANREVNYTTVSNASVNVDGTQGLPIRVNEARIVTADINAANGVIHIIDRVLTPR